jgi:hypothetical protein
MDPSCKQVASRSPVSSFQFRLDPVAGNQHCPALLPVNDSRVTISHGKNMLQRMKKVPH